MDKAKVVYHEERHRELSFDFEDAVEGGKMSALERIAKNIRNNLEQYGKRRFGDTWKPSPEMYSGVKRSSLAERKVFLEETSSRATLNTLVAFYTPGTIAYAEKFEEAADNRNEKIYACLEERANEKLPPREQKHRIQQLEESLMHHRDARNIARYRQVAEIIVKRAKKELEVMGSRSEAPVGYSVEGKPIFSPRGEWVFEMIQGLKKYIARYSEQSEGYRRDIDWMRSERGEVVKNDSEKEWWQRGGIPPSWDEDDDLI